MYHQYAPFFTEFMNKLKSGSGLLYTWNLGLGTDFVSLMAYYLSSPFNWLLLLCPSNLVIEFMTVLILIKIGLSGLTFAFYLNRHYKDNGYRIALFAVFYALSGFMCAYNWDIMWLDTVVLLPLILLGLERLVEGKKMTLLCGNTGGFDSFKLLYFHYGLHLSGALFCDSDIRSRKAE